jgi:hypothetical protein
MAAAFERGLLGRPEQVVSQAVVEDDEPRRGHAPALDADGAEEVAGGADVVGRHRVERVGLRNALHPHDPQPRVDGQVAKRRERSVAAGADGDQDVAVDGPDVVERNVTDPAMFERRGGIEARRDVMSERGQRLDERQPRRDAAADAGLVRRPAVVDHAPVGRVEGDPVRAVHPIPRSSC